jgi:low affinity Fe/Cu permease
VGERFGASLHRVFALQHGYGRRGEEPATSNEQNMFERFAHHVSEAAGRPMAFILAVVVILGWAVSGPVFHFDQTWQLVINTGTTIVTFLMVFLIQCMQNRDTAALHIKLDELLRVMGEADNKLIEVEKADSRTIKAVQHKFEELAEERSD